MKLKYISLAVIGLTCAFVVANAMRKTPSVPASTGIAVVELFTSEGCSSCPSAEAALARLEEKHLEGVYALEFHVDYWDRLGWKDPFSQAAFSQRQRQYAGKFQLESIYTPQAIVNGQSEFVGSNETQLNNTVKSELAKSATNLVVTAKRTGETVTIDYKSSGQEGSINFALVQPAAVTAVQRGENAGKTLRHLNVVRVLKTIQPGTDGSLSLQIPGDLAKEKIDVVAYAQSSDLKITGAQKISL